MKWSDLNLPSHVRPWGKHPGAKVERLRRFAAEIASARERQRLALDAYERAAGTRPPRPMKPGERYPGLLDQRYAAEERVFRYRQCRKIRRAHFNRGAPEGLRLWRYAPTFARSVWVRDQLDPVFLANVRKQVQRQARKLQLDCCITGVVDICWMDDRKSGVKGWSYHVHLHVQAYASSFEAGKEALQTVFPYPPDDAGGMPNPRDFAAVYHARGWDHYGDELFQWGMIRQRVTRVNPDTGLRLPAECRPLTKRKEGEWAVFLSQISADNLMIWFGHRRYGNRVLPIPCNQSKVITRKVAGSDI